ncbi:MAG: IPT/TIG domain-containing protein [Deltaproteobacteria bacterium]|nr:IPT/TIG domain-containing protein [Deltaproteobacteria bacterium]
MLAILLAAAGCSSDPVASDSGATDASGGDIGKAPDGATLQKLAVTSVTPARGGLDGGEQLDVTGTGFGPTSKVFIGNSEAAVQWRAGTTHIFVTAPPAKVAGLVDVRVGPSKASAVVLKGGYAYLDTVSISDFAPASGPMSGGSEITVRGEGFRNGDRVLVGFAEALNTRWIDDKTLIAQTPPYSASDTMDTAKVVVSVRHAGGVAHAKDAFTYGRAPKLERVKPAVVGVGGGTVTLSGMGLGNAEKMYAHGALGVLQGDTAGGRVAVIPALGALDPAAQPGPADMVLISPYGNDKLSPAFAYVDSSLTAPVLYGVTPNSGLTSGGTEVVLLAGLPDGAEVQKVLFGTASVQYKQNGTSLQATSPAGPAGSIAVTVVTSAGTATLDGAFTRYAPVVVNAIAPPLGPIAGGTTAKISGSGFAKGCLVRLGMYSAEVTAVAADGKSLTAITPAGAPGAADVEVKCGSQKATLANGFGYTDGHPHINAVSPPSGSVGGSAVVKIYGSGFKKGVKVHFGGLIASGVTIVHSGLVTAVTPAHPAGPVNVDVLDGSDSDTLLDGYDYYAPGSPDGGTWGTSATGTLNVTVLDIYTREPIEDATVQLGSPGDAVYEKYSGNTKPNGMIVFSGPEVIAPVRVSATKSEYTSSSIVQFDATNATLLLFPYTPPQQGNGGGGGGPVQQPFALVKGKVVDIDKYLVVPPSNCLNSTDLGDKTCKTCQFDADCQDPTAGDTTFRCVDNGPAGKRCLADCSTQNVCKKGFVCVADVGSPSSQVCKPTIGIRAVYCATTIRDIGADSENPPPSQYDNKKALPYETAPVNPTTGEYEMTTRLDELAVVCVGGYIVNETETFVPTAMGVHRHVFPKPNFNNPGDPVTGIDVKLNIPLSRTLQVRLDHPQPFLAGLGATLQVSPWIDLGSDGLVRLPGFLAEPKGGGTGVVDDVALPYQPVSLPVELSTTHYAFYAHALFGSYTEVGPITLTLHDTVFAPGDSNFRVRATNGETTDSALGVDLDLTGIVSGSDGRVAAVGRNGGIWRGYPKEPLLIWLPPVIDPYEKPPAVLAIAGTPTDATMVGAGGLVRRLLGSKVVGENSSTKAELRAVCAGALGRVAVGAQGAVIADRGSGWQPVAGAKPTAWNTVVCTPFGAVAGGDGGSVLRLDLSGSEVTFSESSAGTANLRASSYAGGKVWLGGDLAGGLPSLWLSGDGSSWETGWPLGSATPAVKALVAVVPLGDGGLLLVDREGGQFRLDAKGLTDESPERRDLRPRSGTLLPDGTIALVGEPGLWLGPFLTVPTIDSPAPGSGLAGAVQVEWSQLPGPKPSFTRVHLDAGLDPQSGWGFPFWWIYVGPTISAFTLPDFQAMGIDPFPQLQSGSDYAIRVDRGYIPNFSINGFATYDLEFGRWRSRASNFLTIGQP